MYSRVDSPGVSRTTCESQIFSNKVRPGIGANEVYNALLVIDVHPEAVMRGMQQISLRMNRRDALRLFGVAMVGSLVAACQPVLPTPTATPTPVPPPPPTVAPTEVAAMPGMRLAIDSDPDTLDPAGQTNPTVSSIVDHMVETLVRLMPDGSIGSGLARKYSVTPDGRTYTFDLREDVEFHDGGLLNA